MLKTTLLRTYKLAIRVLQKPEGLKKDSVEPVSRSFGLDRGTPIDRYYIEHFLQQHKQLVRGTVLEIAENTYSKQFGSNVTAFEILHVQNHPNATIVGDLTKPETLPSGKIDCFICTQTFNFIYDFQDAIRGSHQMLAPGGSILATVAGISQISRGDMEQWGDFWRFTRQSAGKAFEDVFGPGNVKIGYYGNCLAATSFLRGLTAEEIPKEKLDIKDDDFPVTITIVATKSK
jgi:hypothetical protein